MARRVSRRKNVRRKLVSRGRRMQTQLTMPLFHRRKSAIVASKRIRGAIERGWKRRGQPTSTTTFKRRRTVPVNSIQQLSKSRRKVYMQKYKMSRVVNAGVNHMVERFQNVSNFDTNVGSIWVDNARTLLGAGPIQMPMLIFDMGSLTQRSLSTSPPPAGYYCQWLDAPAGSALNLVPITGTNSVGVAVPGFVPEDDNSALPGSSSANNTAILDWVNLRFNLYGQRKRTTRFVITVFQITDDEIDIREGLHENTDMKALFQYLERPFIYSNLMQDNTKKRTGYKVIKEFTYNVEPMTSIDLNTTTGNIHEANIHMKINKKLDYNYVKTDFQMIGHSAPEGSHFTVTNPSIALHNEPKPKQNVFVSVRAFAPVRVAFADRTAADSPSVDFIIRRGITLPI